MMRLVVGLYLLVLAHWDEGRWWLIGINKDMSDLVATYPAFAGVKFPPVIMEPVN